MKKRGLSTYNQGGYEGVDVFDFFLALNGPLQDELQGALLVDK